MFRFSIKYTAYKRKYINFIHSETVNFVKTKRKKNIYIYMYGVIQNINKVFLSKIINSFGFMRRLMQSMTLQENRGILMAEIVGNLSE